MTTGQIDIMFCNSFISEAIQLLINSIFLYEDGNFDCAFYSIRQASEVANNMLYLSNTGKLELGRWNNKGYFPMNAKLVKELENIDANYTEVKTILADFFKEHDELIKSAHKIIHKQGFDSFYAFRIMHQYSGKFNKESETHFFLKLLKSCIGKVIILFIVVEPLSLVLADEDLSTRCNFDSMTEAVDIEFFQKYLSEDIIDKIKNTSFFKEFSSYFATKEKMTPKVFNVVRNNFFDIDSLDEIEKQKHLLNLYEQIILKILQMGIKLSNIYPDCSIFDYYTSMWSNYHTSEWSTSEYHAYLKSEEVFNQPYHDMFRSIIKVFENNWIFDHNELLTDKEIVDIKMIVKTYREQYETVLS
ncbi:hypothetical protein [uncultured Clostridium sp.]|uniref:hypothetical protein n=1 Tax=uncultured Clostridium sp. TaxID=59620 RepID=UPI0028E8918A|nr:hypothetical protein [uncultured Clostridium sp.]